MISTRTRDSRQSAPLVEIPGPYGPPWPLVTEPMEFEIGSAQVKIEIEDENAKYPLGWAMLADEKLRDQAGAGWTTFCEWMGYTSQEIGELNKDLAKIGGTKPFKMEFKPETAEVGAAGQPAKPDHPADPGSGTGRSHVERSARSPSRPRSSSSSRTRNSPGCCTARC